MHIMILLLLHSIPWRSRKGDVTMNKIKSVSFVVAFFVLLTVPLVCFATFSGVTICIDPGHGGSDPGASGYGLDESDVNLDIALRARNLFQQDGATVVMTRTTDTYVSLQGRCDIANNAGADRFISTHCNCYDGTASGTETYCYQTGGNGEDLATHVQSEMVSHMGTTNRGVKTYNFYVLHYTDMSAILGEVAFIDNSSDNTKLANTTYRQAAARAYLHGTQAHYGMTPHDPVTDVIVDNTSSSFSASSYWVTGTSSTDKYGSDYRYNSTGTTSDPATFAPSLSTSNYAVYAWWPAGTNRSSSAPYIIHYNGGTQTVSVNQQTNGGKWNYLGTWPFTNGNNVQLSCQTNTGYVVIADAVKFAAQ